MPTLRINLLMVVILIPLALAFADSPGPFSFVDPNVRIPSGAQAGAAEITLRSSVDLATPPRLTDLGPHPPAADVTFEFVKESNPKPNTWRYRVTVSDLTPSNVSQQHYVQVAYADQKTQIIPYLVTNQAVNFSWIISKLPDPWVASDWLPATHCTSFSVTPKDSPATEVTLGSSTLAEQSTKNAIPIYQLQLCASGKCTSQERISLPANVTSMLELCTREPFHGNFHGVVTLASAQKLEGEVILQSAEFSSFLAKFFGTLLIVAGVFLAWWAKVWARARLERDQALMPVLVMQSQLKALQEALGTLVESYKNASGQLNQAIQNLLSELTDAVLDSQHLLPPAFPNPFGYTVDAAGLKAYLEARNVKLLLYSVLVKRGVLQAVAEVNGSTTPAQQALIVVAIKDIGKISAVAPLPTADQALPLIQTILTALHKALFPPPAPAAPGTPTPSPDREFQVLQLEMIRISKAVWVLYAILTALSGLAVLILNNPAFGVPLDFVFALFWGFGLPTTIASIGPASASTALNISIAKS